MKPYLGAAALAVTTVLAVPAFASAHGSVYKSNAKVGATLTDETRYFVTNHGFSFVLRETNGLEGTKGMVGYNLIPTAWRTGKDFATVMGQGGTGAQPHATCATPALETEAAIKSWQDADPFYNYVPFQATAAGLEDSPARWLPTLQAQGFDTAKLDTAANAEAECERVAGATYYPADAVQTTAASLASGTVAEATEALNEEIDALEADNATLEAANATLTTDKDALASELAALKEQGTTTVNANSALSAQVAGLTSSLNSAQSELAAAKTQISSLLLAATPIKLNVTSAKAKTVASNGAVVAVTAQPLKAVTVTVSITEAKAKQLKLASSVLGKQTVTTTAAGTASVTVKVSKAAAKALKALKGSLSTTVEATSGDRFATATSKFTR